jgi:hypothetical protein
LVKERLRIPLLARSLGFQLGKLCFLALVLRHKGGNLRKCLQPGIVTFIERLHRLAETFGGEPIEPGAGAFQGLTDLLDE